MKTHIFSLLILSITFPLFLTAQTELPIPREIQAAYDKGTRSKDGKPGPAYWQNSADYDIRIRFVPETRTISGTVDITYFNNSPDTLRSLLFKLYPNFYKKGVSRMRNVRPADLTDGVEIRRMVVNEKAVPSNRQFISGTNMSLRVAPIAPGQKTDISLSYAYTLNERSHNRTGQVDTGAWFIAYFFPRLAVYDDIDRWSRAPYLGSYEFYNDMCNFNLSVTVPENYLVWATGDWQNCQDVLAGKFCDRLKLAEETDSLRFIIDQTDVAAGGITRQSRDNTFRFTAKEVPDIAVAVSNHYIWQSGSLTVDPETGRRTRVDAVYNPDHKDFNLVASDAWKTVEAMSYRFPKWPFPYSHMTVFDGLDQMEYPMMANDNPIDDRAESIELTDHEIFHTMFPFYMGTNEVKYAWMDEGWATIGEWLITPMIDSSIVDDYGVGAYAATAGRESDIPIMTLTTQQAGITGFTNAYPKPALGYLYVMDMLGKELFFKGLHEYIRNWNRKHPMPYDFFYSMNSGTGVNLNWFWKAWFFDDGAPDLSIGSVREKGKRKTVVIKRKGAKPVPIDLTIHYSDGSSQKIHRSIAVWSKGEQEHKVQFRSHLTIKQLELGSTYVPDTYPKDNRYPMK